jgi:diguanylate cyclase (GGDEF)-like protein
MLGIAFAAQLASPDAVALSFLWVPAVVAAVFAGPRAVACLAVAALILAIIADLRSGIPNTAYSVGRLVAWGLVAAVAVLLAGRRAEREARLAALATHDPLTGLANRRLLESRLSAQLAVRGRTAPSAVFFADIDRFKAVNDEHGHATGDAILIAVAERLLACTRSEDTVARIGGDEFVVGCPDIDGQDGAEALCRRVMDSMTDPVATAAGPVVVRLTLGAVVAPPDDGRGIELLVDAADRVMLSAKGAERGSYRVSELRGPRTPG